MNEFTLTALHISAKPWLPAQLLTVTRNNTLRCLQVLVGGPIEHIGMPEPIDPRITERTVTLWGHDEAKFTRWIANQRAMRLIGWPTNHLDTKYALAGDVILTGYRDDLDEDLCDVPADLATDLLALDFMAVNRFFVPLIHPPL